MACQTCDHTMYNVGVMHEPYTAVPLFWCPRCGTLKANVVTEKDEIPKLIARVREFVELASPVTHGTLFRLGVLESIGIDQAEAM